MSSPPPMRRCERLPLNRIIQDGKAIVTMGGHTGPSLQVALEVFFQATLPKQSVTDFLKLYAEVRDTTFDAKESEQIFKRAFAVAAASTCLPQFVEAAAAIFEGGSDSVEDLRRQLQHLYLSNSIGSLIPSHDGTRTEKPLLVTNGLAAKKTHDVFRASIGTMVQLCDEERLLMVARCYGVIVSILDSEPTDLPPPTSNACRTIFVPSPALDWKQVCIPTAWCRVIGTVFARNYTLRTVEGWRAFFDATFITAKDQIVRAFTTEVLEIISETIKHAPEERLDGWLHTLQDLSLLALAHGGSPDCAFCELPYDVLKRIVATVPVDFPFPPAWNESLKQIRECEASGIGSVARKVVEEYVAEPQSALSYGELFTLHFSRSAMGYDAEFEIVFDELLDWVRHSDRPDKTDAEQAVRQAILATFHLFVSNAEDRIFQEPGVERFEREFNRISSMIEKINAHFDDKGVLDKILRSAFCEKGFVDRCVSLFGRELEYFLHSYADIDDAAPYHLLSSACRHMESLWGRDLVSEFVLLYSELYWAIIKKPKLYWREEILDDRDVEGVAAALAQGLIVKRPSDSSCALSVVPSQTEGIFTIVPASHTAPHVHLIWNQTHLVRSASFIQNGLTTSSAPLLNSFFSRAIAIFQQYFQTENKNSPLLDLIPLIQEAEDFSCCVAQYNPFILNSSRIMKKLQNLRAECGQTVIQRIMGQDLPKSTLLELFGALHAWLSSSVSVSEFKGLVDKLIREFSPEDVSFFCVPSASFVEAWRTTLIPKRWCVLICQTLLQWDRSDDFLKLCEQFPYSRRELEKAWLSVLAESKPEIAVVLLVQMIMQRLQSHPILGLNDVEEMISEYAEPLLRYMNVRSNVALTLLEKLIPQAIEHLVSEIDRDPLHSEGALLAFCSLTKGIGYLIRDNHEAAPLLQSRFDMYRDRFLPKLHSTVLDPLSTQIDRTRSLDSIGNYYKFHSLLVILSKAFQEKSPKPLVPFNKVETYLSGFIDGYIEQCETTLKSQNPLPVATALEALYYALLELRTHFEAPDGVAFDKFPAIKRLSAPIIQFFSTHVQTIVGRMEDKRVTPWDGMNEVQALLQLKALIALLFPSSVALQVNDSLFSYPVQDVFRSACIDPMVEQFRVLAGKKPLQLKQMIELLKSIDQAKELLIELSSTKQSDCEWFDQIIVPIVLSQLLPVAIEETLSEFESEKLPPSCYEELLSCVQLVEPLMKSRASKKQLLQQLELYNVRLIAICKRLMQPCSFVVERSGMSTTCRFDAWIPSKPVVDTFYRQISKIHIGEELIGNRVASSPNQKSACKGLGREVFKYFKQVATGIPDDQLEKAVVLLIEGLPIDVSACMMFELFVALGVRYSFVHKKEKHTSPAFHFETENHTLVGSMSTYVLPASLDNIEEQQPPIQISVDVCVDPATAHLGQWTERITISCGEPLDVASAPSAQRKRAATVSSRTSRADGEAEPSVPLQLNRKSRSRHLSGNWQPK